MLQPCDYGLVMTGELLKVGDIDRNLCKVHGAGGRECFGAREYGVGVLRCEGAPDELSLFGGDAYRSVMVNGFGHGGVIVFE